jgi:tetratricopeptide (TPR) repeat protein
MPEGATKRSFFGRIWAAIKGLFVRQKTGRVVRGIAAAPLTLVARISAVDDKERQAIKLAEEAIRRGYPEQAVVAYWKAAAFFMEREQFNKALSMLNAILKLKPDDMQAAQDRVRACEGLDRKRDAAFAYLYVAQLHEANGRYDEARAMRARSIQLDPKLGPPGSAPQAAAPIEPIIGEPEPSELEEVPVPGPNVVDQPDDGAPIELELERSIALEATSLREQLEHANTDSEQAEAPTVAMEAIQDDPIVEEKLSARIPSAKTLDPSEEDARYAAAATVALPAVSPPPAQRQVRFAIPQAATTADLGLPSAVVGSEHEANARDDLSTRIPAGDTKSVTPEELRALLDRKLKRG